MIRRTMRLLGVAVLLNLVFVAPAAAYIDAGSTAVMFQAIVAGIAAASVSVGMFWSRITSFFRGRKDGKAATPVQDTEGAPPTAS